MIRFGILAAALFALTAASQAHFVFIVPDAKDPDKAQVVFSDNLEPDPAVDIGKIAGIKLKVRGTDSKETAVASTKGADFLAAAVGGKGDRVIFGSIDYGVMQKGDSKPFLLKYHAKAVVGSAAKATKVGDSLPVEFITVIEGDKFKFQFLAKGKPIADAEVTVILPDGKGQKVKTDKDGFTTPYDAKGRYGAWTRYFETTPGELDGKKYEEVRHYATLVVDFGK